MATKNVTIMLRGSLSHTVKRPGKPELKLVKGRPHPTDDPDLVAYCKAKPQLFSVTGTLPSTEARKAASAKARKNGKGKKKTAASKGKGKGASKGKTPSARGRVEVEDSDES